MIIIEIKAPENCISRADICLRDDLEQSIKVLGTSTTTGQPIGKYIYRDVRTNKVYDAIAFDSKFDPYIYMINTETI